MLTEASDIHPQEVQLVFRAESGMALPTRAHAPAWTDAYALGTAHYNALVAQTNRQIKVLGAVNAAEVKAILA